MQLVSNTVKELVNALEPIRLALYLYGDETPLDAAIVSCTVQSRCGGGDQFSIGSACSGSVNLVLASSVALGLKDKLVELKWSVKESWYPLFTGYCTRERVENGSLSVELNDAIYVYGSLPYEGTQDGADALSALNSVRSQMGIAPLDSDTAFEAEGMALSLDNLPEGATLADALALISGCMGGNAVITRDGSLAVRHYQMCGFSTPCYDGSDAKDASAYTVTGLTFLRRDTDADGIETETAYAAGDGALRLENNLATQGLTNNAYAKISGLSIYAGTFSVPGGLLLEPGDIIRIETGGETFQVACMDLVMELDGGVKTTVTSYGEAETGGATGSLNRRVDIALKGVSDVRDQVIQERTAREQAVEGLNKTLADASGLYLTADKLSDGSTIYYFHNKKTLKESSLVIKFTSDAIGVSNDGGKTYEYGFTANGDAILNLIYAKGINANYIKAGTISGIKIIGTEGTIGGLTMSAKSLTATYRYDYPTFTSADVTKVQNYAVGLGTLTDAELEKYDVNMDGRVTTLDAMVMNKMINGMSPKYSVYKLTIDASDPKACVCIEITEGYHAGWSTKLGIGAVRTRDIIASDRLVSDTRTELDGTVLIHGKSVYGNRLAPEMKVGSEYQTMETFMGYPVYVQLVDCGAMPNAGSMQVGHGISNIRDIVARGGVAVSENSSTHGIPFPLYYGNSSVGRVDLYCNSGTIFITTTADWSGRKAYVWLKYTKTTD